jgi:hypothetical protein
VLCADARVYFKFIMCEVNGNDKMGSECNNKSYFSEVSGMPSTPSSYYELSPNHNNSVSSTRTISNNSWVNDQQQTNNGVNNNNNNNNNNANSTDQNQQDTKHSNNNSSENKNSVNESLNSRSNKSSSYGQPTTNFQMPSSQWNFSTTLGNSYQRLYNDYHNYILSPNASQCALVPTHPTTIPSDSHPIHIHQMQTSHHLKKFYYQGAIYIQYSIYIS